jgi:hypothetical protein
MSNSNGFKIQNSTELFNTLMSSQLNATNLNINSIELPLQHNINSLIQTNALTEQTLIAYAPASFRSVGFTGLANLLTVPGLQPDATSPDDLRLACLPDNAVVTHIVVDNNGTTLTGLFNVAIGYTSKTVPASAIPALGNANPIIETIDRDDINNVVGRLASATFPNGTRASRISGGSGQLVVEVTGTGVLTGDLRAIVSYVIV